MTDTITYPYDFDPYAENSSNLIINEAHTITAATGTDFNFIVPRYAPFFRRSFVCVNTTTNVTLRAGVDYYFGFRFDQVIVSGSSLPVYGAIVFNDPSLSANIEITYQTLGGEFTQSATTVAQLMANTLNDPRTTQWSAVVTLPTEFPPIAHRHDVDDWTGFSDVISALNDLGDANTAGFNKAMQALLEHIADKNNPHDVTLEQLGIDALGNLIPATQDDATTGTDNTRYMTALRSSQLFTAIFEPLLTAHENDTSNPHSVTKDQVGLGLVENYRPANALEASAGVATNLVMTPQGTTLAMQNQVPTIMEFHTSNTDNPHDVTAAQVGLGNVPNYAMADESTAILGQSKTTLLSPYLANLLMVNATQQPLAAHIADKNNPHDVTATQVGLDLVGNYGIAADSDAATATRDDLYLTPGGMGYWWTNVGKTYVDNQIALKTNLTAADVGLGSVVNSGFATTAQNTTGTATQVYVDPAGVTAALGANVLSRNYSASPAFVAKLITGFPAGLIAEEGTSASSGSNSIWTASLRTISSPLLKSSGISSIIFTAPSTYSQKAYVDVSTSTQVPGFIFGSFIDSTGNQNYAAILFKSGSVYLGTYNGTAWTNGTAVSITALTGTSVLVSCAVSGTNMSVTVGSTTVNVDISSVTFSSTGFVSNAGFIVIGANSLIFTPISAPGLSGTILDVTSNRIYDFANDTWAEETGSDATLPSTLSDDLRAGRIITNSSTGEAFISLGVNNYFWLSQPQLN